jgi:class I fructose-bisphosphate aldolase
MNRVTTAQITRNGNALILAYDHGTEHGPVDFEPMPKSADPTHVFEVGRHDAVTAIALQKGIAEYYRSWEAEHGIDDGAPLLVKVNGNSNLPKRDDYYSPTQCSVDYAVEHLDADAIGYTMYAGSIHEDRMWTEFREIQETARECGVPVVMWSYPRGTGIRENDAYTGQEDPAVVAYGARLGLELGADVVKCKYPGSREGWTQVEDAVGGLKTVMSGGSKRSDEAFLDDVYSTVAAGGNGLAVGRNIFQREDPEGLLDELEPVIFEGADPRQVHR